MSQLIIGLYNNHQDATAAANELDAQGYSESDVRLVNNETNYIRGSSADGLAGALQRDGLWQAEAKRYDDWVAGGGSLVSVRAPFGMAKWAIQILQFHAPVELRTYADTAADDPQANPPFSAFIGWPVLSDDVAPVSRMFGMPLLSNNPTPFSALFGWPTLSQKSALLSALFGLPLLSRSKTPLSSMLGLPLLIGR